MSSLPATTHTYVCLLIKSPDGACFCLLVSVVESWISSMAERFPRTAAGLPNAQIEYEREKEVKLHSFIDSFIEKYPSTWIPPDKFSIISFGRLGTFLHLALFQAWSNAICIKKKPPIKFPDHCLVGRYALLVGSTICTLPETVLIQIVCFFHVFCMSLVLIQHIPMYLGIKGD